NRNHLAGSRPPEQPTLDGRRPGFTIVASRLVSVQVSVQIAPPGMRPKGTKPSNVLRNPTPVNAETQPASELDFPTRPLRPAELAEAVARLPGAAPSHHPDQSVEIGQDDPASILFARLAQGGQRASPEQETAASPIS